MVCLITVLRAFGTQTISFYNVADVWTFRYLIIFLTYKHTKIRNGLVQRRVKLKRWSEVCVQSSYPWVGSILGFQWFSLLFLFCDGLIVQYTTLIYGSFLKLRCTPFNCCGCFLQATCPWASFHFGNTFFIAIKNWQFLCQRRNFQVQSMHFSRVQDGILGLFQNLFGFFVALFCFFH